MKKEGMTLNEIGKKFRVSGERIRQLLQPLDYCYSHRRYFRTECELCQLTRTFKAKLSKIALEELEQEIARLSVPLRVREMVLQRAILIKFLKETKRWNRYKIAKALNRDFTSIDHLYKKYEKDKTI